MGVDLGTQSIKVIIYDFENKKIISTKSQSYELISKEDGSMEQQASWWIDGFEKCLENIDDKLKKTVIAIGVSGQQHGFVPIDKNGAVLAP